MLEVNRLVLERTEPALRGTVDDASELIGRVTVDDDVHIARSRIVEPVLTGARSTLTDSYAGPFTSVAEGCAVVDSGIEYSIVLRGAP